MIKQDILAEIDWYERRIIEDPEGEQLYKSMIRALRRELKKYVGTEKR